MGNVTLPPGPTDARINAWLADYLERHPELSQASLGRAIGKNDAWMSRHMAGRIGWTQTDLDKIAEFLNVDSLEIQRGPREAA